MKESTESRESKILKENIAREKEAHEEIAKMKIEEVRLKGQQEGLSEEEIDQMIEKIKEKAQKQFKAKKQELKKESQKYFDEVDKIKKNSEESAGAFLSCPNSCSGTSFN